MGVFSQLTSRTAPVTGINGGISSRDAGRSVRSSLFIEGDGDMERLARKIGVVQADIPKVLARALNRTAQNTRTNIVRGLRDDVGLNLRAKDIRSGFDIHRATWGRLEARVAGKGPVAASLYLFAPRPKQPGGKRPTVGISVQVLRKSARKPVPQSFLATINGVVGIYRRKGKERFPIKKLFGPSYMAYMRPGGDFMNKIEMLTRETLFKNVTHEAKYLLDKARIGRS